MIELNVGWLLNEVENFGLFLFQDKMEENEINSIINLLPKNANIMPFIIKVDDKFVLGIRRFIRNKNERIDYHELNNQAKKLYKGVKYEEALKLYLKIFESKKKPKPSAYLFESIGECYSKLNDLIHAETYLKVANLLNKKNKNNHQNESVITKEEKEYDITKINEGINFINEGKHIDYIKDKLNLNYVEYLIISLLLAEFYYYKGFITIGDKFLKIVEKSKNKPKYITNELECIRKNKLFYQYRNESEKKLVMKNF